MDNYKQVFNELKAYGEVKMSYPMSRQQTRIIDTLASMKFVSIESADNQVTVKLLPQTITPDMKIQVSHWKDGKRKDKFSQAKYPVTHRYGSWITYQLTDTMIHVIPIKRTQKVA